MGNAIHDTMEVFLKEAIDGVEDIVPKHTKKTSEEETTFVRLEKKEEEKKEEEKKEEGKKEEEKKEERKEVSDSESEEEEVAPNQEEPPGPDEPNEPDWAYYRYGPPYDVDWEYQPPYFPQSGPGFGRPYGHPRYYNGGPYYDRRRDFRRWR